MWGGTREKQPPPRVTPIASSVDVAVAFIGFASTAVIAIEIHVASGTVVAT